jgi:hypothetical protein
MKQSPAFVTHPRLALDNQARRSARPAFARAAADQALSEVSFLSIQDKRSWRTNEGSS